RPSEHPSLTPASGYPEGGAGGGSLFLQITNYKLRSLLLLPHDRLLAFVGRQDRGVEAELVANRAAWGFKADRRRGAEVVAVVVEVDILVLVDNPVRALFQDHLEGGRADAVEARHVDPAGHEAAVRRFADHLDPDTLADIRVQV